MQPTNHSAPLQIGDVARMTSVSVDAIRFYERRSLLPKAPRTPGRFRLYSDADVSRLNFIKQVQGLGFSLSEVRQFLDLREQSVDVCADARDLVRSKLGKIRAKIRELEQLERHLTRDLRRCNSELRRGRTSSPRACPVLKEFQQVQEGN